MNAGIPAVCGRIKEAEDSGLSMDSSQAGKHVPILLGECSVAEVMLARVRMILRTCLDIVLLARDVRDADVGPCAVLGSICMIATGPLVLFIL